MMRHVPVILSMLAILYRQPLSKLKLYSWDIFTAPQLSNPSMGEHASGTVCWHWHHMAVCGSLPG